MSIAREQEFKALITATQATQLQAHYPFAAPFTQTNRYYDTQDQSLRQLGWGLRIRQFNDHSEQTLKIPAGPHRQLLEYTDPITNGELAAGGTVAAKLATVSITLSSLFCFAEATTTRRLANLPAGLLTLDQTAYPNGNQDWEVELEYSDYALALPFWQTLQRQFGWRNAKPKNKIQRASKNVN